MNSHITLPKSTLRRFEDGKYHKISYYDLSNRRIHECFPKYYNTQMDYYSQDFEKWLSTEVETYIGRLHKNLENFEATQACYAFDYDYLKNSLIRIVAIQIIRMPDVFEDIMNPQRYTATIDKIMADITKFGTLTPSVVAAAEKYRDNISSKAKMRATFYTVDHAKMAIKLIGNFFQSYVANFALVPENLTSSFILTPTHFFKNGPVYFIPLSPRFAFVLLPESLNEQYVVRTIESGMKNIQRYLLLSQDNLLDFVSDCVKSTQKFSNKHLIAQKNFLSTLIRSGTLPS